MTEIHALTKINNIKNTISWDFCSHNFEVYHDFTQAARSGTDLIDAHWNFFYSKPEESTILHKKHRLISQTSY